MAHSCGLAAIIRLLAIRKTEKRKMSISEKKYKLGELDKLKKPEGPEVFKNDFINLDMTVSTDKKSNGHRYGRSYKTLDQR